MGMPARTDFEIQRRWTAAEVRALQDATYHEWNRPWKRYELIDGELIVTSSPTWKHQRAVALLFRALDDYVRAHRLGEVVLSPADLELEPEGVTQPDLFVVPESERTTDARWSDIHRLLVAAEVLSPSTARYDRVTKRRYYLRNAVPEYWIVDTDARLVERWRSADAIRPEVIDAVLSWHPDGAPEPFTLDLAPYFAEVHGEPADGPR
jgi:Uma2 family endonuclease